MKFSTNIIDAFKTINDKYIDWTYLQEKKIKVDSLYPNVKLKSLEDLLMQ